MKKPNKESKEMYANLVGPSKREDTQRLIVGTRGRCISMHYPIVREDISWLEGNRSERQ